MAITNGEMLPGWKKMLPVLACPFCGKELMELRVRTLTSTSLGWTCDCDQFTAAELLAEANMPLVRQGGRGIRGD